jgi:putative phosphoribosyl transferase
MRSARAMRFENRADAGRKLAERLASLGLDCPVVLGLPRGGIPVAAEVASLLGGPLEAFVARKVGAPGHEEFGIGAVAEGLEEPIMSETATAFALGSERLRAMVERSYRELSRQVALYRGDRALPELAGRQVVLVDDGLATGVTAEAALVALRRRRPSRLVLGVPVCAPKSAARLAPRAEDVVWVHSPARFVAVSYWYHDFSPTTDQEIIDLLAQRRADLSTEQ